MPRKSIAKFFDNSDFFLCLGDSNLTFDLKVNQDFWILVLAIGESGPILEFKGSIRYVQKGHPGKVTQGDIIIQNWWEFKH